MPVVGDLPAEVMIAQAPGAMRCSGCGAKVGAQTLQRALAAVGGLGAGARSAGVVLGIAPWNAPIILAVRAICVPLACGNTVILKGSENCPRTHQLIIEAFQDAGFPPGVVNYITNAPADAGAVV